MPLPPKPATFTPARAPEGVEVRSVDFADQRPPMLPVAVHVHTNGARREGSLESAWNHAHAAPNRNTLPHYQLDRTHDGITRCRKMLATDLRGIGTATVGPKSDAWPKLTLEERNEIAAHGNAQHWTIVVETADTGTDDDPTISAFDDGQVELLATIIAYEAMVWGIPLVIQSEWWSPGVASHTDPFTYPYTTLFRGKQCPGDKKKAQVRQVVLPRAVAIREAWLAPPPAPVMPKEAQMIAAVCKTTDGSHLAQFEFHGPILKMGETDQHDVTVAEVFGRGAGLAWDVESGKVVSWSPQNPGSWGAVRATLTTADARFRMGGEA